MCYSYTKPLGDGWVPEGDGWVPEGDGWVPGGHALFRHAGHDRTRVWTPQAPQATLMVITAHGVHVHVMHVGVRLSWEVAALVLVGAGGGCRPCRRRDMYGY